MVKYLFFIFTFILFISCNFEQENDKKNTVKYPEYAKGFFVEEFAGYKKISIVNPWQNSKDVTFEYYLINNSNEITDFFKDKNVIKTPITKAVYLSSTYLGYVEILDKRNSIVGISGVNYVYDTIIEQMIIDELISEVGFEQNLDIEKIIELEPDVVFAYDINGSLQAKYETLKKLGIQVVIVGEYLETHPLGRAEWIKFFGTFFELDAFASDLFSDICVKYNQISTSVDTSMEKAGVVLNTPFQGVWYLPGKNSYMAKLINDAGGNYLFKKLGTTESFSVGIEEILLKNDSIEVLLNPGQVNSISEILDIDKRIGFIDCINAQQVFNNNKRVTTQGGNDFWEIGVVSPHIILNDLSIIFAKDTAKYEDMVFYTKLSF